MQTDVSHITSVVTCTDLINKHQRIIRLLERRKGTLIALMSPTAETLSVNAELEELLQQSRNLKNLLPLLSEGSERDAANEQKIRLDNRISLLTEGRKKCNGMILLNWEFRLQLVEFSIQQSMELITALQTRIVQLQNAASGI